VTRHLWATFHPPYEGLIKNLIIYVLFLSSFCAICDRHHKFCVSSTFAYDGDNKNRLNRTNRIPFVVGREIFPYKGESRGPFEPTALVIAVNQFRHEIDSKSQVPQTFAVLLLFLFLSFFRTSRCLRDTRSTTKKLKFHRLSHFMGACEVDQSFILKVLCTHA